MEHTSKDVAIVHIGGSIWGVAPYNDQNEVVDSIYTGNKAECRKWCIDNGYIMRGTLHEMCGCKKRI